MQFPDICGRSKDGTRFAHSEAGRSALASYLRWLADAIECPTAALNTDGSDRDRAVVQTVSHRVKTAVSDFPIETLSIEFCHYRSALAPTSEAAKAA